MRVYLSGAAADLANCEYWRDCLREQGHEVTVDWMAEVRENSARGKMSDRDLSMPERFAAAREDLDGVTSASAFWLLVPPSGVGGIGCWVELGYALFPGVGELDIIVSGDHARSIFCALASYGYATHEEAFQRHFLYQGVR